jgi:hypothetical protein
LIASTWPDRSINVFKACIKKRAIENLRQINETSAALAAKNWAFRIEQSRTDLRLVCELAKVIRAPAQFGKPV